jgi:hypothetical protein
MGGCSTNKDGKGFYENPTIRWYLKRNIVHLNDVIFYSDVSREDAAKIEEWIVRRHGHANKGWKCLHEKAQ